MRSSTILSVVTVALASFVVSSPVAVPVAEVQDPPVLNAREGIADPPVLNARKGIADPPVLNA